MERRRFLQVAGGVLVSALAGRAWALVPATGEGIFRRYPGEFANFSVPPGRPFAAQGVGETPLGTSVLICTVKEQSLPYHRERLEVALVLKGKGVLLAKPTWLPNKPSSFPHDRPRLRGGIGPPFPL
ncbi:hypothetical protein CSW37_04785 [Thermus scotoductus]|uniref:Uncharacterized protein n=1 Tax=Thermus scotoductus TaxID=37636 RepID=A0A430SG73_THESC|nr:hypothetical protein [Thermus scotoductus]RTH38283.1 hypothetical protein CSW37_04785 [Thermus scotoductus]